MLAMHPMTHSRGKRQPLQVDGAEVARMHDVGAQPAQMTEHAQVGVRILALAFVDRHHLDVVARHPPPELAVSGETQDRVAEPLRRQAVDQIDEPVLESAIVEAVDQMRDEHRGVHGQPAQP